MVTLGDVETWAGELPEATVGASYGHRAWLVSGRKFAWQRPLHKADIRRFGAAPVPTGPILAVQLADLGERDAVLAAHHRGFFTIEHFDGFPAVLVQLDRAAAGPVRELLVDGWLAAAPEQLAQAHAEELARRR